MFCVSGHSLRFPSCSFGVGVVVILTLTPRENLHSANVAVLTCVNSFTTRVLPFVSTTVSRARLHDPHISVADGTP